MTPTLTDTVTHRLTWDHTLQAFLTTWWEEKEIPVPLIDYLMDHDLQGPAECVRWRAEQPKLPEGTALYHDLFSCPRPYPFTYAGKFWGWCGTNGGYRSLASHLPVSRFGIDDTWNDIYTTAEDAIAFAIDHWRPR